MTSPVGTPDEGTPISTDVAVQILEERKANKEMSLQEALSGKYEIVSVNHDPIEGSYIVLADSPGRTAFDLGLREIGSSSLSPWTAWTREERVSELRDKIGIRTYYDMKRADGTVRGALRTLKTPVLSAHWFIEAHGKNGGEPSAIDTNIAKFVEQNLFENLNVPWSRVIEDALTMCEYGYSVMELVWEWDPNSRMVVLSKLAPRHPLDIREWLYNDVGDPIGLIMEGTEANGFTPTFIPADKLVMFVLEQEGGDLRGTSILRSAYKHYYYKDTLYKIDAIQKERHGIGVPIIKLPMGFTEEDRRIAEELGRNLRTNDRAHIVAPMNWEITFAKLEGQPVDCLKSIEHHDKKILSNVLAPFLDDSNAKTDSMDMFLKSTRYIANTLAETFTKKVITKMVRYNFVRGNVPHLHARRIGEWEDMRTMSFTLRNLVGASLVTPDKRLEEQIRRELDMPAMDMETLRVVKTPQNPQPSPAGPPRQSTKPAVGLPNENAGTDQSGG